MFRIGAGHAARGFTATICAARDGALRSTATDIAAAVGSGEKWPAPLAVIACDVVVSRVRRRCGMRRWGDDWTAGAAMAVFQLNGREG